MFALALAPLVRLRLASPSELGPLRVSQAALERWFDDGDWALAAAAAQSGHPALEHAVRSQTTLAFAAVAATCVYFALSGFANPRLRGWTQFYWVSGLALIFMAPAFFPNFTPERVDFAATFWLGQHRRNGPIDPGAILLARAAVAAAAAAFTGLCAHDLGHRVREALWELGLVDAQDEEVRRAAPRYSRPWREQTAGDAPRDEGQNGEGAGFGHRNGLSEAASAFAALGLRLGASRAEIERAYRERMKRAHPDHGGSAQAAARLNQARDLLLPHGRR